MQTPFQHFDRAIGIQTREHLRDVGATRTIEVGSLERLLYGVRYALCKGLERTGRCSPKLV